MKGIDNGDDSSKIILIDDMKRIAILTTFGGWDEAYSPVNVVWHQLKMLVRYGYEPILFTLDIFPKDKQIEGVEIRPVLPTLKFEPYRGVAASRNVPQELEKDVAKVVPVFEEHFKDLDVILCHDVIFQDSFLPYNAALHKMVMPKNLKLYHWMHSGPSRRPAEMQEPVSFLYSLPQNSKLVYMNRYDVVRCAEMYGVYAADKVRVVHNPIDYRLQEKDDKLLNELISKFRLNDADIIAVYPLSTTRMGSGGKQIHKAIRIMAELKKLGRSVRFVIPNAHANGQHEKDEIQKVRMFAQELGLDVRFELVFTSLLDKKWEQGIPHDTVVRLMRYSDIFLFPSVSENCPLILLEAALGKNLLVLNEDFTPMKDFVGPHALYFKFDSVTTVTNHPMGEARYYEDVAKIIHSELANNRTFQSNREVRQKFNIDYIFKNQLEPLLFEDWGEQVNIELKPAEEGKDQDLLEVPPQGAPDILGDKDDIPRE